MFALFVADVDVVVADADAACSVHVTVIVAYSVAVVLFRILVDIIKETPFCWFLVLKFLCFVRFCASLNLRKGKKKKVHVQEASRETNEVFKFTEQK